MKIYLFLSDKLLNFSLPIDIMGSYSFDEDEEEQSKLINIEARDNKWYLYSTDDVHVFNNNQFIKEQELVSNNFYFLSRNNKIYTIYICDLIESNFNIYSYGTNINVIIGNNESCNLKYQVGNNNGVLARINYSNNNYNLLLNNNTTAYINDTIVRNSNSILKYGDVISVLSLKIVFLKDIILINNPMNLNNQVLESSQLQLKTISLTESEDIVIKDRNLYSKEDYFSKSPRIRRIIEGKEIKLSTPPRVGNGREMPLILTLGPMLTMGFVSAFTVVSSISKLLSGSVNFAQQIPSLLMSAVMLISTILWPLIIRWYTKRLQKKQQKEIIEKYSKYLDDKRVELDAEYKLQKEINIENLITPQECVNIINKRGMNFWDKRVDQEDFLLTRIGVGDSPLRVKINFPEDGFTIEEDELKKQADKLIEEYRYIINIPVGYSFFENRMTAIMGGDVKCYGFINNIILQLITFYSYEDIKLVVFTNEKKSSYWKYVKYLKHNFNNEIRIRFYSENIEDSKTLAEYLLNELNYRVNSNLDYPKPHYIILIDDYEMIKNYDFIKQLTENSNNLGFSCIFLENSLSKLPSKCSNFITLGVDNRCGILKNSFERQEQSYFKEEIDYNIDMMSISKKLSNIPIEFEESLNELPDSISFLEMEKVGKVEQLNILNRWNTSDTTTDLKAEIGVDEQGSLMYLDLHEKAHGPHGLIAGTTGSGKSEFIITYILSMCINYSPDDVSFILIDYKGGGLALAFENKVTGIALPHLAGTITNLDKAEMDRTLVSIDSEVKKRQNLFNIARDNLGESTIDIYKYQKYYHEGRLDEPLPHLFIICDEFAELKSQQPEFMDNLISVARIGRSLGVHLILATQKPSGVVNEQIWSNSRFKVCLKVQDESDSREMLKKNDAAYLKQAGRFYLQVGYDELYLLGQSGWCGAKYYPSDKIVKEVDKSINIINNCGLFIKSIQASKGTKVDAQGEQLGAVLKNIIDTANRVGKFSRRLWLDNIPDVILVDDLVKKYNVVFNNNSIEAVIGEYDAPEKQEQGIVKYNYLEQGNTIVYGNDGGELELFLHSLIYSTVKYYSSNDINFYAIDYGSEALNKYLNLSHFGGVVINGEDEEFNNLLKLINNELKKRKKLFADFGGEYKYYNQNATKKVPVMVIIFNSYDSIYENNQNLYEILPDYVRDSERYGIVFIFTANTISSIHRKIAGSCKNIYAFKLKDSYDYNNILGAKTKTTPRDIFGRGLINNDGVHEFQVSKIVEDGNNLNAFLSNFVDEINKQNSSKARKIPLLPEIVRYNDIQSEISSIDSVPFGISKNDLDILTYDFTMRVGTFISSNKLKNTEKFVVSLLYLLLNSKLSSLIVIDPLKLLKLDEKYFKNYVINNIEEYIDNLINYIQNLKDNKKIVDGLVVIYGLDKFINIISKSKMEKLSELLKTYEHFYLIMLDDASKIKSYLYDSWVTSIINNTEGIWIGKGLSDQGVFRLSSITKQMSIDLKNNMGYYINEGSATLCKLIDFISKDDEDGK